jgi:hypothetical protein
MTRLRISIPPLSATEALALSRILDRIDEALWRHYGEQMTTLLDPAAFPDDEASPGPDTERGQLDVRERER